MSDQTSPVASVPASTDAGPETERDPRVRAVLAVLGGAPVPAVAREFEVEPSLLHRWVRGFLDAGTAEVTNRPDERAAKQRDRFLTAFAHEVRTPLASALGWVRMLEDGDVEPEESAGIVLRLRRSLDRLHERTRDVELLAAASLGRVRATPEPVSVAQLAADLGAPEVGGAGGATVVHVDRELFHRVLRDLWAAAATEPQPRARSIEVHSTGRWTEIGVVRDADPVDPTVLQSLFEPFDLADDASGVTIGLYLARALTVLHGGTIGVRQDDDRGELWVRVPRTPETES